MSNGYEMIRNHAGLVDLADWVRFEVTGPAACDALDSVLGANLADLFEGKAMNTLIPSETGGVEAMVWVMAGPDGYLVLAEPEEFERVANILAGLVQSHGVTVFDRCGTLFHMVLTGPDAEALAAKTLGDDVSALPFLSSIVLADGITALRIGFFGEYELHLLGDVELQVGLVARLEAGSDHPIVTDSGCFPVLMAEMRILNRARDIPDDVSVFEAGLQWMIDFHKPGLRGADALDARRDDIRRQAVLMVLEAGVKPAALVVEGKEIGTLQSVHDSATLGQSVGIAFLDADLAVPGIALQTSVGIGQTVSAPVFLSKSVLNALGRAA